MNLAVHPDFRRNKIGTQLLIAMGEIGIRLGCKRATLEVRITNYAAQLLYEELGFRRIKVIPHYYEDSEDAFLMESPLPFPAISVATKITGRTFKFKERVPLTAEGTKYALKSCL